MLKLSDPLKLIFTTTKKILLPQENFNKKEIKSQR